MLQSLRVRDFLLVEEAVLEPGDGLAVLTGETGTGKSILLSALALLLGGRGSAQWVRPGAAELQIEAVFRASPGVRRLLRDWGLPREGETLVLVRRIDRRGRSRCSVNDQRVLVGTLRRLGGHLVELHGQREEERFRRSDVQRELLDLYGGHQTLRRRMRERHLGARRARAARDAHRARLADLAREEDWLRYQVAEIDEIDPQPGERERLREEVREVGAQAERAARLDLAEELLNGAEGGILAALESLDHETAKVRDADEAWSAWRESIRELRLQARATHRQLTALRRSAEAPGGGREALEGRLRQLEQLERKHRRSLSEILTLAEEMRTSLETLERGQQRDAELSEALRAAEEAQRSAAQALREARKKAAPRMTRALERELRALGMPDCRVRIALPRADAAAGAGIGPRGSERVVFEVETNPAHGFRPLGEIASGGEMSRVALAIRVVLGSAGRQRLTVFDEIDAGLGGAAAKAVAQRLAQVAGDHQVLLVTHLPVIAARAGRQFRVAKQRVGRRNVATVERLADEARVEEIARMLAGDRDARARDHARALLEEQA
ncbi:MAG: DNA repair protein RecN [Candidatus Eisenbacteria bacterium]|nr:DNA repair protein RecN [Candidatus Eisenbacteria bacterium]